jgi:SAM-dependent MidA family methyltransferase
LKKASILAIDFQVKLTKVVSRFCQILQANESRMNHVEEVIGRIIAEEGCISFARFMEMALYLPEHGYYERDSGKVGRKGDFYTSVSVGSLFGELLAFQFVEWLEQIGGENPNAETGRHENNEQGRGQLVPVSLAAANSDVGPSRPHSVHRRAQLFDKSVQLVEAGAHDGRLALDILTWIDQRRPEVLEKLAYCIIEPSTRRRQWQEKTLERFGGRVQWFDSCESIASTGVRGIIFANELLDAFPVHRLGWDARQKTWFEWGVCWSGGRFDWVRLPESPAGRSDSLREEDWPQLAGELLAVLPDGFITDISPAAKNWWHQAAASLGQGKLLTLDYGLTGSQIFSPERAGGTLRAYREHHVSAGVLDYVGEQDLTAQVDFTTLQCVGEQAGLRTERLSSQTEFLTRIAEKTWTPNSRFGDWSSRSKRQFQTLIHPEHLGRAFQVLVQSRRF